MNLNSIPHATDSNPLPMILFKCRRTLDDDVRAEAPDTQPRDISHTARSYVAHAGQVEEVDWVGVCEVRDCLEA